MKLILIQPTQFQFQIMHGQESELHLLLQKMIKPIQFDYLVV